MIVREDFVNRKMRPLSEQHFALVQIMVEAKEHFDQLKDTNVLVGKLPNNPITKDVLYYISLYLNLEYGDVERKLKFRLRQVGGQAK